MDTEQLPLVHRDAGDSLQQQLSSYHKRQRKQQQRRQRSQTVGRATIGFLAASLVTLFLVALSWPAQHNERTLELRTLLDAYQHERNFSGIVRLSHNGHTKVQQAMGFANVPFQQPMEEHSVFPMGAHVQLLVAVALYQLQEQGRVLLHHAVDKYWTESDWQAFDKKPATWCPHTQGSATCELVTFEHLLYMGSGIQRQDSDQRVSLGQQVKSFLDAPLAFKPGTNYQYAEENYVLLVYMIEQLSGQRFDEYLTQHVFQVLGLTQTTYDPENGAMRVRFGVVDQYVQFYAPSSQHGATSRDSENGKSLHHMSTGSCAMYQALATRLSGLLSTGKDMHTIYMDLFHARGQRSKLLSPASITQIVTTRNPAYQAFAQGIGVNFKDQKETPSPGSNWPVQLAFCSTLVCSTTCMAMHTPTANLSILASAFTNDVRLLFPSLDALDAYHARDFLATRQPRPHVEVFEIPDGEVNTLAWNLVHVFRHFNTAG